MFDDAYKEAEETREDTAFAFYQVLNAFSIHSDEQDDIDQEIKSLREELDELQCDDSTNFEICHLVAEFFSVLEGNEKHNHFQLHYDDLPIYYIPSHHKDRLYLMANLFTKVIKLN